MTGKSFFNKVANGKQDILNEFVNYLKQQRARFCVIGGLAVNAYTEPVVSLDLDIVVAVDNIGKIISCLPKKYKVKHSFHSINISSEFSDLRIQLQTDIRYQEFIKRASQKNVLGYKLPVASIADVLQGKLWAYSDPGRRPSKRQKDLADIMRLIEVKPALKSLIPKVIQKDFLK
ncbi:MAG: hypothetical protein QME52_12375 [Bacteroidota bacterium]|nr:hypothetical protein [Bacteroidota bacterium]